MNRSERRKAQKRGITSKDLRQEGIDATRYAADAYSVAVAWVLYDKLHFGEKKMRITINQINDLFDSILKGYCSIEDLKQALNEEIGIKI